MAAVDLVTRAELKAQLEVTTSAEDSLLDALITAASRAIARRYHREFTPKTASATRRFRVDGCLVDMSPHDLRTASAVTLHPESASPQTLTPSVDYVLGPVGGSLGGFTHVHLSARLDLVSNLSSSFGFAQLDVAGAWGLFDTAEVPEDIKRACIITVGAWTDRAVAEYAVPGADGGWEVRPDRASTWAIPSAAHRLLEPWARVVV